VEAAPESDEEMNIIMSDSFFKLGNIEQAIIWE
jgi:hypothetical protein